MSPLREARTATGLTQEQLGEIVGVSGAVISRYESGALSVPPERVFPLLDALRLAGAARTRVWEAIVPPAHRGAL